MPARYLFGESQTRDEERQAELVKRAVESAGPSLPQPQVEYSFGPREPEGNAMESSPSKTEQTGASRSPLRSPAASYVLVL